MNRIEEIKERLNNLSYNPEDILNMKHETRFTYHRDGSFIVNAPSDIQYLLSRLEIAEKALEDVMGVYDNVSDDMNALRKMNKYASEALQQIRE